MSFREYEEWVTRNLNRTSDNQQHLILILFYLINPLIASLDTFNKNIIFKSLFHFALMQNETKNQDLDFQRSITVLIPKRKKTHYVQTVFLFTAFSNYWHSLANLMSGLDADLIFDTLLYKLKRNVISTEWRMNDEKSPSFIEQRKTMTKTKSMSMSKTMTFLLYFNS